MFNTKVHGLDGVVAMRQRVQRLQSQMPFEMETALVIEMEIELKEVKARTPEDTGALKDTIVLAGPFRSGRTVWMLILAGGTAAPYALIVHEDLDAYHATGQAKYVESVILESAPHMAARIAARIDLNRVISGS